MKPGLVIGLGGTGVLSMQHIKAQLSGGESRDLPPNVKMIAFDTVQEQERSEGDESMLKGVALKSGEYYWIGGDVYDYTTDVRRGKHPHVGSWLQAETYLKTLSRSAFTLQRGAGQLRQFGRLAVFRDVSAPALSNIAKLLNNAMTEIRNTGHITNLDVYLIASVAGGTGAGMFVDLAYLVRRLAEVDQNGLKITLRGFLVLPEAFNAIPGGINNSMRARAYAAMRENRRFMVDFAWKTGYPMHYQPSGEDRVWRTVIQTKLFDSLYHIDGQRGRNPLTNVLPKFGVTATIADSVVAMLDDPKDAYGQHNANVMNFLGKGQDVQGSTSFDSAVGTYTMQLPMRELVESLSYSLLLQGLSTLLKPATYDEDGYILGLLADSNAEAGEGKRGRDAAADFLSAGEIKALAGDDKIVTTLLPAEILKYASRYSPTNQPLIMELAAKPVVDWENVLDPTGDTADVLAMRDRVRQELQASLLQAVPHKVAGEKAADSVVRLPREIEAFKGEHLGREDPRTGQRSGGKYRLALEQYAGKHVERFKDALQLEVMNILNGSPQEDPRVARGGKLPFLKDMLEGLDTLLGRFVQALDAVHTFREQQALRTSLVSSAQAARQGMEQKPSGMFGWGQTQKAYVEAEHELVQMIKVDVVESLMRSSVLQMQAHTQVIAAAVDSWISTLATGYEGIYGYALRGQKKLGDILKEQGQVKVRRVLPASDADRKAYLTDLMNKYGEELQDGLGNLLGDIRWQYERRKLGGKEAHGLGLVVGGGNAEADKGQEHNLQLLLSRCRSVFADAWQQESILKYLMKAYPRPDALAQELVENGGPLLAIEGGKPVPANYFHIWHGNDKTESAYLQGVKTALVNLSGATGVLNEVINSADHFSCRLVYTLDLIPLESVQSYNLARTPYYNYSGRAENGDVRGSLGRETLHLFPAEVNAAKFEVRIPTELNLPMRELHNDVVLQLEKINYFRMFARAWVFNVVMRDRKQEGSEYLHFYALKLPQENWGDMVFGERKQMTVYLTEPGRDAPSLLEALETFQYIGKDVQSGTDLEIPYERLDRAIDDARTCAVDERMKGEVQLEPLVQQYMARLPDAEQLRVKRLMAERAILKDRQQEVHRDLSNPNSSQKARDAAVVFWLALQDEIKSVQEAVSSLLQASGSVS